MSSELANTLNPPAVASPEVSGNSNAANPPTNTAAVPGGEGQQTSPSTSDWTGGLPEELKSYVGAKGFKDPQTVVESYRNLEKLLGGPKERLLRLPEKMDDPAALGEVFGKLGKPEKADDYKIDYSDPEFVKWAKETFHQANLTKAQADVLAKGLVDQMNGAVKSQEEAYNLKVEADQANLKREWGKHYDQEIQNARAAFNTFIGPEKADLIDGFEKAMGFEATMKFFAGLGRKLGESNFHGSEGNASAGNGGSKGFVMTKDAALEQINMLKRDKEFLNRWASGDHSAREKLQNLQVIAFS